MKPDCERVADLLGSPLPADLEEHARGCAECLAALEAFVVLSPVPREMDAVEISSTLRTALAAAPPAPWWIRALTALLVALAASAGGALVLGIQGNEAAPGKKAGAAALLTVSLLAGVFAAASPRGSLVRRGTLGLVLLTAVTVPALGSGHGGGPFWATGLRCLLIELAVSLLPLAAAVDLTRQTAFSPMRAWLAGTFAGVAGLLVLHGQCPNGTAEHLAVFHVAPWLALGGVALGVRSRLSSRTFAP